MKRSTSILVLAALVAVVIGLVPSTAVAAPTAPGAGMAVAGTLIYSGTLNYSADPYHDYFVDLGGGDPVAIYMDCADYAGDELDPWLDVYFSDGTLVASHDDTLNPAGSCQGFESFVTFVAPKRDTYRIRATTWNYVVGFYDQWADGPYVLTITGKYVPLPGCDQVPLPATAVVGQFVSDAMVYWTPGELADPVVTLEAGKTAWVLGMDASGQYYQIFFACDYLWVPANTMGPNPDEVWNNTPLPTTVVGGAGDHK